MAYSGICIQALNPRGDFERCLEGQWLWRRVVCGFVSDSYMRDNVARDIRMSLCINADLPMVAPRPLFVMFRSTVGVDARTDWIDIWNVILYMYIYIYIYICI